MIDNNVLFKRIPLVSFHLYYLIIRSNGLESECYEVHNGVLDPQSGKILIIDKKNILRIQPFRLTIFFKTKLPNGIKIQTNNNHICLLGAGFTKRDYFPILRALKTMLDNKWNSIFVNSDLEGEVELMSWQK